MEFLTDKDNLERYEKVNSTSNLDELRGVVQDFADERGMIRGQTRDFKISGVLTTLEWLKLGRPVQINVLTRNWGIRQQAIMLYNQLAGKT